MGFCTKCGKPLKDGEICSCQQQTPQMTAPLAPTGAAPQMTAPQAPAGAAPQKSAPQAPTGAAPQMSAPQAPSSAQMEAVKQAGANAAANYFAIFKGLISTPLETIN